MNARKLTDRQKQALDVYNGLYTALGYPPSIREFKEAYGVYSNSTAFSMLSALRKLGFKCLTRGQARNPGQRSAVFSMGDADQTVELNRLRKICAELVDENEGLKVDNHTLAHRVTVYEGTLELVADWARDHRQGATAASIEDLVDMVGTVEVGRG